MFFARRKNGKEIHNKSRLDIKRSIARIKIIVGNTTYVMRRMYHNINKDINFDDINIVTDAPSDINNNRVIIINKTTHIVYM